MQTRFEYDYKKVWRHKDIDDTRFHDKSKINTTKSLQNEFTYCDSVKLGNYIIDIQAVIQLGWTFGRSQYK